MKHEDRAIPELLIIFPEINPEITKLSVQYATNYFMRDLYRKTIEQLNIDLEDKVGDTDYIKRYPVGNVLCIKGRGYFEFVLNMISIDYVVCNNWEKYVKRSLHLLKDLCITEVERLQKEIDEYHTSVEEIKKQDANS